MAYDIEVIDAGGNVIEVLETGERTIEVTGPGAVVEVIMSEAKVLEVQPEPLRTMEVLGPAAVIEVITAGHTGALGPQGIQGIQGPIGPQGTQGIQGPIGEVSALYVQSRTQNLVTNGQGLLGTNFNFTGLTFDAVETHGGGGSFKSAAFGSAQSDELIPIDPEKFYRLIGWAKSGDTGGANYNAAARQYLGVASYDIDGQLIVPEYACKVPGSTNTTLAVALNPGATTVTLTDATGWHNGATGHQRRFLWWPYVNAKGYSYPNYTYSRNISAGGGSGSWASGGITGNVITLSVPWAGPTLAAGTAVMNSTSGGTFKYIAASNAAVPTVWTRYEGFIGSVDIDSSGGQNEFFNGTAYVKLLFLLNYPSLPAPLNNIRWSDITFTEISTRNLELATTTIPGVVNLAGGANNVATLDAAGKLTESQSRDMAKIVYLSTAAGQGAANRTLLVDALASITRGVVFVPGTGSVYEITGYVDVVDGKDLQAAGSSQTNATVTFKLMSAASGIRFDFAAGGSGGYSGGFKINANALATNGMFCGISVAREFRNIDIVNGANGKLPDKVTAASLTSNIATLTTQFIHGRSAGQIIDVDHIGAPFDGKYTILDTPTTTSLRYNRTNANIGTIPVASKAVVMEHFDTNAGLKLEGTQNCKFIEVNMQGQWIDVILDKGAGTNVFDKCEFGRAAYKQVRIQGSADIGIGVSYPLYNAFNARCIFEYGGLDAALQTNNPQHYRHLLHQTAGSNNGIFQCHSANANPASEAHILLENTDGTTSDNFYITDVIVIGTAPGTGVAGLEVRTGAGAILGGLFSVAGCQYHIRMAGGGIANNAHIPYFFDPTVLVDWGAGIGATYHQMLDHQRHFMQVLYGQQGQDLIRVVNDTEAGIRFALNALGQLFFHSGTGYTADTTLYRHSAGVLGTGTTNGFRTGYVTTAARPSAATVGVGTMIYDTTLSKPIWSNGSVWKDADGVTV